MSSDITQQASVIGTICEQGPAGKTPIKGVDYWTEADKAEIVQEAMPHPDWNENNSNSKNYIKNRPGGYTVDSKTIEWDGNSEGKVSLDMDDIGPYTNVKLVKVSDIIISTEDQIIGETLITKISGNNSEMTIEEETIVVQQIDDANNILLYPVSVDDEVLILFASFPIAVPDIGIPEPGTYFLSCDFPNGTVYISYLSLKSMIIKIPLDLVDTSKIEETIIDISSTIDSLATSTNTTNSKAEKAVTTANSALATANSALATANAASSSIDNKADVAQVEMLQSDYDQFKQTISDEIDRKYDELGLRIDNISDDYINNLIDTKLGVIENGTY